MMKENSFPVEKQEADYVQQKIFRMQTTQMIKNLANTPV